MSETAVVQARDPLEVLRRPATIRARCAAITAAASDDRSANFRIDRSRLGEAARRVEAVMRRRYPDLRIPLHSRWRHFEAGGVDRKGELDALLGDRPPAERARVWFDLTAVSVLLDAGAGAQWSYLERAGGGVDAAALPPQRQTRQDLMAMLDRSSAGAANERPSERTNERTNERPNERTNERPSERTNGAPRTEAPGSEAEGRRYTRSEGLGVATFRAFLAGAFSSTPGDALRADAAALRQIDAAALRALFQAGASNPLVGLEGRAGLLTRLGEALHDEAARHGFAARPALVYDLLTDRGARNSVTAAELLQLLLRTMSPIWRSGSIVMGMHAGDIWPHRWAGADAGSGIDKPSSGWVPLHKLTQWLAYSLIEPLQWAGVRVDGIEVLTALPEYRNGGLLVDTGVIVPRSTRDIERRWKPGDEFIVEWRALTVSLIDELATMLRARLDLDETRLPLACILEGGTWAAGREIAHELRGGAPPFQVDSDGTVF